MISYRRYGVRFVDFSREYYVCQHHTPSCRLLLPAAPSPCSRLLLTLAPKELKNSSTMESHYGQWTWSLGATWMDDELMMDWLMDGCFLLFYLLTYLYIGKIPSFRQQRTSYSGMLGMCCTWLGSSGSCQKNGTDGTNVSLPAQQAARFLTVQSPATQPTTIVHVNMDVIIYEVCFTTEMIR